MIENSFDYIQYLFFEYIGLLIAVTGLFIIYNANTWKVGNKIFFYLGYILLIIGTIMFIYRFIFT